MADRPNRPNRPIRPRQGAPPGGRKRRVVIDTGAARPRENARQARERAEARPKTPREVVQPTGPVTVESGVTVKDLSQALGKPMPEIIKILMALGAPKTATQSLSDEEVELMAAEIRPRDHDQARRRRGARARGLRGRRGRSRGPPAGRHDHGPRRPRQDDAARRDPQVGRRRDRGRRDHAAHRRLPGASTTAGS